MKKSLIAILLAITALSANAWEDGFYRFTNVRSGRTAYLTDNHASIDTGSSSVDLRAIELFYDPERCLSDPATVLYINYVSKGSGTIEKCDISAQGYSVYGMIGEYINFLYYSSVDNYQAWGSSSGVSKYLSDPNKTDDEESYMGSWSSNNEENQRRWKLRPISASDDANYFGLKANVNANGKYYSDTYASFAYTLGSGMEAYYVSKVDNQKGIVVYSPVNGATVAGGAPVFVKCNGSNPSANRVTPILSGGTNPSGNMLKGVYFDRNLKGTIHISYTAYDKSTMRVLGVDADGDLAYVTADCDILPRNASYLVVDGSAPATLKLMTADEYAAGIAAPAADALNVTVSGRTLLNPTGAQLSVYSILGAIVYTGSSTSIILSPGVYVVRTPATATKIVIR